MLVDSIKIKIQSGKGGHGSMATFANQSVGGDGGDGGDVYFVGSSNVPDLFKYSEDDTYKAENGSNGMKQNKKGSKGKDLILQVPLVTEIRQRGNLLFRIEKEGEKVKVLTGGTGSLGNVTLKRKSHNNLPASEIETLRQEKSIWAELTLKLKSDIIFIGYPNAGKSSLLNMITNANVKTASYAFTTLEPQRGMMNGLILMDLPGLIDGTYVGKGLGTKFVKHTENSRLLAHFVSMENPNPYETYKSMRVEIEKISSILFKMPELVILTKTDESTKDAIKKAEQSFIKKGLQVVSCSIIDDDSMEKVKNTFTELLKGSKED
jgi:GTP-binding protein